jgi:eukaryotic-like serine/threonine-protein kinase
MHRASAAAERADQKQTATGYEAGSAMGEALVGNDALAKSQAKSALKLCHGRDGEARVAIALSLAGDSPSAMQPVNDLNKRFPQDTVGQFNYLPTIRAASELRSRNPGKAIPELIPAAPYESAITALDDGISLYPAYVRGAAFLAAKQRPAAAVEFQKIIDHRA